LITSSFLYYQEDQKYGGFQYFYFTIVTFSTVGFGDIYAETEIGRAGVILSIISILFILPKLTSNLLYALELKSNYARKSYRKTDLDHIVISGDI